MFLVLTVIGDDRPGLVDALADTVAAHGGNWLESSMSHLAGKFAGVLRVEVDDARTDDLVSALAGLSDRLRIVIEHSAPEPASAAPPQTFVLSLVGNDRPGIVRDISRVLARLSINVEQLSSECVPAPMSGDILFRASATIRVPEQLALAQLQAELEQLADDLMVELQAS